MRVFVAGGTGAIGGYAVPALVGAGHTVTALARNPIKAATLNSQGATPMMVSLFDTGRLAAAVAGHDAVVNLASALPSTPRFVFESAWAECERVRTEGSAALVAAALAANVPRVVQESIVMMYRDGADRWLDENWPVDRFPIAAGNHAAEASANRFAQAGGIAVVLRFGMFYGRGAAHSKQIMAMARRHIGFQVGRHDSYVSSIHLTDAASAVVASLECPTGNYNIVDDQPVTARDNTKAMARAVRVKPWVRGPGRAALLLGNRSTSITRSLRVSNARFRATANWAPLYPSVWEGYSAMADTLNRS